MTELIDRIEEKIERITESGCWIWMAGRRRRGYGAVSVNAGFKQNRTLPAHRVVWELYNNKKIPAGMCACHTCDIPECVNPHHIFIGTKGDNTADMIRKKRGIWVGGEAHYATNLSSENVQDIRVRYAAGGILQRELAAEYGLDQSAISDIVRGESWAT